MLTGRGVSLESQFRLTYSMILNLLRVEDLKVSKACVGRKEGSLLFRVYKRIVLQLL